MALKSAFGLFLLFVLGAAPARAGISLELTAAERARPLPELYRAETVKVLSWLKEYGATSFACRTEGVDCLTIDQLLATLAVVKFREVERFDKLGPATRWTAFYSPEGKEILLNRQGYQDPTLAGFLGLHELFGILGRPEVEYQLSSMAFLYLSHVNWRERVPTPEAIRLIDARMAKLRKALLRDYSSWKTTSSVGEANEMLLARGGGTLIGGGGDGKSFLTRIFFLSVVFNDFFRTGEFFIEKITSVPIELAPVPGAGIAYHGFKSQEPDPNDLILVPSNLVGEDAGPMVREIAWFYASLLPEESVLKDYLKEIPCGLETLRVPRDPEEFHPAALANYWRPLVARRCPGHGDK